MTKAKTNSCEIDCLHEEEFFAVLRKYLNSDKPHFIAKVNTEFLLRAANNKKFTETLEGADLRIADGSGVQWAARYLTLPLVKIPVFRDIQAIWQMIYTGASLVFNPKYCTEPIPVRFPGLEAMYMMLKTAEEVKAPVYFFGSEKDVLEEAIVKIQEKYPNLKIVGHHDGWNFKDKEVIKSIQESKAKLLIVALGSPKQEFWIEENLKNLPEVRIAVGEGGSLDFVVGAYKRSPKWMRLLGLEWLWRLFANKSKTLKDGESVKVPRAKRVFEAVPMFILEVVKFKIRNGEQTIEK